MATLAEQLANLANPAPIFQDPEDTDDYTKARLTEKLEDDDIQVSGRSTLRQRASGLLADTDIRYAGKKVTRKKLQEASHSLIDDDEVDVQESDEDYVETGELDDVEQDESDEESGDESGKDATDDSGEDGDEDDELAAFRNKMKKDNKKTQPAFSYEDDGDYSKYADDYDEDDDDDDEDDEDDDSIDDGDSLADDDIEEESLGSNDDANEEMEMGEEATQGRKRKRSNPDEAEAEEAVQSFSKTSMQEEIKKGQAAKAQLGLWDSVLKGRIELQKLLQVVNQLPQPETAAALSKLGDEDYGLAVREGTQSLKGVLDQLVSLQTALLSQNPETRALTQSSNRTPAAKTKPQLKQDDDDEEITSEEDEGEASNDEEDEHRHQQQKRIKLAKFPEFLAKRHTIFQPYRNDVIQKWFDKTRVASGKLNKGFTAFEQSTLKQIEQIMSDKERLIRRTQLKRSTYGIVGQVEKSEESREEQDSLEQGTLPTREHLKDYDPEIFDDDDFYHQLLRDLIEKKTSNTNDPIALTRQWLEIQKLRNKVKKKVDRKASKGRKIRYDIHPKLVNFMAPADHSTWLDESRDELYSSLFGKRYKTTATAS